MQHIDSAVPVSRLQGLVWRKSRYSNPSGNCVELAQLPDGGIAVRNSRYPDGATLIYTRAELAAFVHAIKKGDFDDLVD